MTETPAAARGARRSRAGVSAPSPSLALQAAFLVAAPGLVVLLGHTSVDPLIPALVAALVIGGAAATGGTRLGVAAAILAFIPFDYYAVSPGHAFSTKGESLGAALLFLFAAVAVGELSLRQRRATAAAEEAQAAATAAAERAERLQRTASALSEAVTPQEVLEAVLREGVSATDARAGVIAVASEDGETLEVIAQVGYDDRFVEESDRWHRFRIDADLPLSEAVRTGTPVFVSSREERDARFPLVAGSGGAGGALACLPMIVEGRTIGGLVFSFGTDREFGPERRALKLTVARQAAQALERARLYDLAEASRARAAFLAEASALLSSSLDHAETLRQLTRLAVPRLADWCSVDLVGEAGTIERLAVAHQDPAKVRWAEELQARFPPDPDAEAGVARVLRTGEPEYLAEIPQELLDEAAAANPELQEVISQLGLRSYICVPLVARGRMLGALSLVAAESGRLFTEDDFALARELGARAGAAVDNAELYRESERRGNAARALAHIGEGVVLLDRSDRIRFWNPAMETLTGVSADDATGRAIDDVVPGWRELRDHVVVAGSRRRARVVTLPLATGDAERWMSVTAVRFAEGSVYALRDVTEEQALERARSEFVATASHELRTPIAAVYGAVRTLRRPDIELSETDRELFFDIIESEGERLGKLVDQILVAGEIDADTVRVDGARCDLAALAERVLASARAHAPENITLELRADHAVPLVVCDEAKARQVISNLVDNAIKYSPDGGAVSVEVTARNSYGRLVVRDEGLGIPAAERERIFEKFYRLDPSLTRGVGGSGLGLYISRELVGRMQGTLTVESTPGEGSAFVLELPTL